MEHKVPTDELRIVYGEILRGASRLDSPKFGEVIIKHLTQIDTELLDIKRTKYKKRAEEKGLPTEQERLEDLIKEGDWSKEKEKEIEVTKDFISRMEDTRAKMALKSEIRRLSQTIEEEENKLEDMLIEKKDLLGLTSDSYANKKVNDYYVYISLYKDLKFEKLLFSEKEFDEVSEDDLTAIILHFNKEVKKFAQHNLKRIAISHFFLNNFYLCDDNPFTFYGTPVVKLTYHQADLFTYGRHFKHLISEMKSPLTNEMIENPDLLTEQYNIEQNKDSVLKDTEKSGTASTVVGATKEDLESLGVAATQDIGETIDLNDALAQKGGTMNMEDLIKLHGQ
tara:strand:- start:198 stop:1211 length:1014 start_codon:yes stop_codon:yes gene_type:complete